MTYDLGEWAPPDPQEVAGHDALQAARDAAEAARQQERATAEERRQAIVAREPGGVSDLTASWHEARAAHRAAELEYTALAEQQHGQRAADRAAAAVGTERRGPEAGQ